MVRAANQKITLSKSNLSNLYNSSKFLFVCVDFDNV